jgi:hypothetical protein
MKNPLRISLCGLYDLRDDVVMQLFCPTCQLLIFRDTRADIQEITMYFVAAVLAVLSGLFYAAGNHEIGSYSSDVCRYGSTFCDHPHYVLVGAGLAAAWGAFVSIR